MALVSDIPIDPDGDLAPLPAAPVPAPEWLEEDIALLLALRAEGLTCVQVAERMGKTKGMIVGKLYRLANKAARDQRPEAAPIPVPDYSLPALPAPRVARPPLETPAIIYLSGPVAPAVPKARDILDLTPKRTIQYHYPLAREKQAYDYKHGSPEQIARLEYVRKIQEDAWYGAGYSREKIVKLFEGWPVKLGYPAYEWTVGPPPLGHRAWR